MTRQRLSSWNQIKQFFPTLSPSLFVLALPTFRSRPVHATSVQWVQVTRLLTDSFFSSFSWRASVGLSSSIWSYKYVWNKNDCRRFEKRSKQAKGIKRRFFKCRLQNDLHIFYNNYCSLWSQKQTVVLFIDKKATERVKAPAFGWLTETCSAPPPRVFGSYVCHVKIEAVAVCQSPELGWFGSSRRGISSTRPTQSCDTPVSIAVRFWYRLQKAPWFQH